MRVKARPECWPRHPQSEGLLSAVALVAPHGCGRGAAYVIGSLPFVCVARQFNHECRPASGLTSDANSAPMITDHRLNDCEPEPRAMRLAGVIRSEQARALFWRESGSRIRNFHVAEIAVLACA